MGVLFVVPLPPQGRPLHAARTAGLDDVELAPGGVYPHVEPASARSSLH